MVLVDTSVWIEASRKECELAFDSKCRIYAKDKHFETMAQELDVHLYRPGYGGRFEPE